MDCIIAMRSQTYAAKGGRLLQKNGIASAIVSIDPSLTRHGCAYGLQISQAQCANAKAVLDRHKVSYGDILGGI